LFQKERWGNRGISYKLLELEKKKAMFLLLAMANYGEAKELLKTKKIFYKNNCCK
jgi:hypothetical protein